MSLFYADALAFFSAPGKAPVADPELRLHLAHVTSVPPWVRRTEAILQAHVGFTCAVGKQQALGVVYVRADFTFSDRTLVVCGLQHPPEDAGKRALRLLKSSGIRITAIAYDKENCFGGGFAVPDAPLTEDGEDFVEACADAGMILDLSHAGHRTARDVLAYVRRHEIPAKIIASHGGCHAVYPHLRNLPDDVLQEIAARGGVVGIYTLTFGLHESDDTVYPFFAHLRHALRVCGEDAIVVGSDSVYATRDIAAWQKECEELGQKLGAGGKENIWNARFPDQPLDLNRADRMGVLASHLAVEGELSDPTISKVVGGNLERYFQENL